MSLLNFSFLIDESYIFQLINQCILVIVGGNSSSYNLFIILISYTLKQTITHTQREKSGV